MKWFRLLFAVAVCVIPASADTLNIDVLGIFTGDTPYRSFNSNFNFDTDTRLVDLESMTFACDSDLGVFTFAGPYGAAREHPTFNWRAPGDLTMVQVNFIEHFNHMLGTPLPIVGTYSWSNIFAYADGQPSRSASSGYINVTNGGAIQVPAGDTWMSLALGLAGLVIVGRRRIVHG